MASPLELDSYDIIICGGGTAGCVLAARLTEDPDVTVLMLEAGENANDDFRISTPGLFPLLIDSERDWQFMTEPSPGLNGRKIGQPRGKCIGGSSAINLLGLIHPSKAGMDAWAELGNPGWDWDSLAPYYRKFERHCPPSKEVESALGLNYLDPKVKGTDGPICSSYPTALDPLQKAWTDTWKGLQQWYTGDPLTGVNSGGYIAPAAIDPKAGTRCHAGTAYYAPAAGRSNLHVKTEALIEKVEFKVGSQNPVVATGVTFILADGHRYTAKAKKEVILSAGAFASPAILERSGVGSKSFCEDLGIESVLDIPNVGENLQDHLFGGPSFEVKDGVMTADVMRDPAVAGKLMEMYQTSHSGPLAGACAPCFASTSLVDSVTSLNFRQHEDDLRALLDKYVPLGTSDPHDRFIRSVLESPSEASLSICFLPVQFHGEKEQTKEAFNITEPENYVSILPALAHPFSRGSVHIQSKDANVYPKINPRYLEHKLDVEIMARHLMQVEVLAETEPLKSFLKPGGRRLPDGYDASTLDRAKNSARAACSSNYHPSGTCAMKSKELGGVLDASLKVYGSKNVRVCDASIFPIQVRGNIMSSVYAVAEKGADIIKEALGTRT